jgi:hypothetical protein
MRILHNTRQIYCYYNKGNEDLSFFIIVSLKGARNSPCYNTVIRRCLVEMSDSGQPARTEAAEHGSKGSYGLGVLPGDNQWRHSRLRRLSACCSDLLKVLIREIVILNCSYGFQEFNKSNNPSKPRLQSLIIWRYNNLKYWKISYVTSRNVAGSSPGEDIFNWPNPSSRTMALGSTQALTEMSTTNLPGG